MSKVQLKGYVTELQEDKEEAAVYERVVGQPVTASQPTHVSAPVPVQATNTYLNAINNGQGQPQLYGYGQRQGQAQTITPPQIIGGNRGRLCNASPASSIWFCCVPQCMDMRTAMLILSFLFIASGMISVIQLVQNATTGASMFNIVHYFKTGILIATGFQGVKATMKVQLVQSYSQFALRQTAAWYQFERLWMSLCIATNAMTIVYLLSFIENKEDNEIEFYMHIAENAIEVIVHCYFFYYIWSYKTKFLEESNGVFIGTPVVRQAVVAPTMNVNNNLTPPV